MAGIPVAGDPRGAARTGGQARLGGWRTAPRALAVARTRGGLRRVEEEEAAASVPISMPGRSPGRPGPGLCSLTEVLAAGPSPRCWPGRPPGPGSPSDCLLPAALVLLYQPAKGAGRASQFAGRGAPRRLLEVLGSPAGDRCARGIVRVPAPKGCGWARPPGLRRQRRSGSVAGIPVGRLTALVGPVAAAEHRGRAAPPLLRRTEAVSSGTAATSRAVPWPRCGRRRRWSPRSRCSSPGRSGTTSSPPAPMRARRSSPGPCGFRRRRASSWRCRSSWTPRWASGASG